MGQLAHDDAVTCRLSDRAGEVRDRIAASDYPFALVLSERRVLLGRTPAGDLETHPDLTVEEVMDPGPSTVRPHKTAAGVASDLKRKNLHWSIVTTPDGELIGVVGRAELDGAVSGPG